MVLHKSLADFQPHDVIAHAASLGCLGIAVWLQHIPGAVLLGVPGALYYLAAFYETKLVQDFLKKRKARKRHRRIRNVKRSP